ncbi:TPA: RNase adaptor protein RapZ [Mannheimia haemolytica]|nr:RNase adaptor protein RapZ [Mannheimia haemolytica]
MELIIISGRSGSGKSVALRALEDAGYYCVDNIPLPLIPTLTYYLTQENRSAVISLDIRNLPNTPNAIEELLTQLEPLVQNANYIIDTSHLSSHELAENLRQILQGSTEKELKIIFQSFGFKYGLPADSDYVFDVRFLPNPHWNPELRPMTGLEQPVIDFLERQTEVHNFIYQTRNYLEMWLPMLEQNNRSYLTIAIGCTGGKHRSIFIAEQLAKYFQAKGKNVQVRHKSLEKHHKKTS